MGHLPSNTFLFVLIEYLYYGHISLSFLKFRQLFILKTLTYGLKTYSTDKLATNHNTVSDKMKRVLLPIFSKRLTGH